MMRRKGQRMPRLRNNATAGFLFLIRLPRRGPQKKPVLKAMSSNFVGKALKKRKKGACRFAPGTQIINLTYYSSIVESSKRAKHFPPKNTLFALPGFLQTPSLYRSKNTASELSRVGNILFDLYSTSYYSYSLYTYKGAKS